MYAKNCTMADLELAASRTENVELTEADYRDNKIKFRLKRTEKDGRFQAMRPNPTGLEWVCGQPIVAEWKFRRTASVCFHGHYAFFRALFDICPNAVIESSWHGKIVHTDETLRENAQTLGQQRLGNPGNIYHAFQVRECCNCLENDPNPLEIY